ncbi:hypothetical protein CDL15_Pgr010414 [Punica granatum]|uniref:Subtilisin-like protease fibronectin type-III domain-containing protein n=1 Tax=Punica granatum TaxID=22663 RepID=A0A218W3T5_PUNGR|nr:hypothetical protein CDL15_Pgr010414 [Punica granatum]PKI68377.1 hypothetical protein CRG98_011285 [Punica granatum]
MGVLDGLSEAAAFGAQETILKGADHDDASAYPFPSVALDDSSFEKLLSYHNSTKILKPFELAINRTVTNVGPPNSTYKAKVDISPNINITVVLEVISFESVFEKRSFSIGISASGLQYGALLSNEVVWSNGVRHVRSGHRVY